MNFKPLKERIVVKRDIVAEEIGGIYIRESAREVMNRGTVMAIADDIKDIKLNDKVVFGKHDGINTTIDGQDYLIMKENQIWCILND